LFDVIRLKKPRLFQPGLFLCSDDLLQLLQLSPVVQLHWVLRHGQYLANRLEGTTGINLYHCSDAGRGFFVALGLSTKVDLPFVVRSFVSSESLSAYTLSIELP
jgi:hypothetical protein